MTRHFEKRVLPYSPGFLFDLVADIERYPEFLPWCHACRIIECSPPTPRLRGTGGARRTVLTAEMDVGAKGFTATFTSVVTLDRPGRISVAYAGGPLDRLSNEWGFVEVRASGFALRSTSDKQGLGPRARGRACEVSFLVDFAFRSSVMGRMMDVFFARAFEKMAGAFEERARELSATSLR